jgi:hypothetical protein
VSDDLVTVGEQQRDQFLLDGAAGGDVEPGLGVGERWHRDKGSAGVVESARLLGLCAHGVYS